MNNSSLLPRPADHTSGTGNRYLRWAYYVLLTVGLFVAIGVWVRGFRLAAEAAETAARIPLPDPKPVLDGRWQSLDRKDTVLTFKRGKFTLTRGEKIAMRGGYDQGGGSTAAWLEDKDGRRTSSGWPSRPFDFYLDWVRGDELVITEEDFSQYIIEGGLDHVTPKPPWERYIARFKRLPE